MTQPVAPPALVFGEGRPVILLHAYPLDGRIWIEHARALSLHYQVIVPDMRGFGSACDQLAGLEEIPINLLADDLAQLMDERAIERATIGGISRGGYVALAFARKYPERLCGLMLFDTRANPADDKERQFYTALVERVTAEGASAAADAMMTRMFGSATLADNPSLVEKVNAIILSQQPGAIIAGARGMLNRLDALDILPNIHVPTICIAGVDDAAFENTRGIAAAIPGAKLWPFLMPDIFRHLSSPGLSSQRCASSGADLPDNDFREAGIAGVDHRGSR